MLAPAYRLQEAMQETVRGAAGDADIILIVTDVYGEPIIDAKIMQKLTIATRPIIIAINKLDLVSDFPSVRGAEGGVGGVEGAGERLQELTAEAVLKYETELSLRNSAEEAALEMREMGEEGEGIEGMEGMGVGEGMGEGEGEGSRASLKEKLFARKNINSEGADTTSTSTTDSTSDSTPTPSTPLKLSPADKRISAELNPESDFPMVPAEIIAQTEGLEREKRR
jgi:hypothetical protein